MNDKFHAKPMVLESALFIMTTSARMVEPVIHVKAVRDDPNDDRARAERSIGRKHHVRQRRVYRSPSAIDKAPISTRRVAKRRLGEFGVGK